MDSPNARRQNPGMTPAAASARPRGRPAAASRNDVLKLATRRYLHGERIDVQAIAAELGLGRATIYRWFGTREELIGEVLVRTAERSEEHTSELQSQFHLVCRLLLEKK